MTFSQQHNAGSFLRSLVVGHFLPAVPRPRVAASEHGSHEHAFLRLEVQDVYQQRERGDQVDVGDSSPPLVDEAPHQRPHRPTARKVDHVEQGHGGGG